MACHNPSYITKHFKIAQGVKPGGTLMINCQWGFDELAEHLSAAEKRYIAKNDIQLYTINAIDLAVQVGMGKRTNTILQSAFFTLAGVLPQEDAIKYMKAAAEKSYAKKGQDIVEANWKAIDAGATAFVKHEVPAEWADCADDAPAAASRVPRCSSSRSRRSWSPSTACEGDELPVSAFMDHADGQFEHGRFRLREARRRRHGAALGRRQVHPVQPVLLRVPHATIRPFGLTEEEIAAAPEGMRTLDIKIPKDTGLKFTMAISQLDCMGCTTAPRSARRALSPWCRRSRSSRSRRPSTTASRTSPPSPCSSPTTSRAASSSSRCLSSPAPAPAAPRPLTRASVTQVCGDACSSPTPPAAPPFGANPAGPLALHGRQERPRPGVEQLAV